MLRKKKAYNEKIQIVIAMLSSILAMVINYVISFMLTPFITNTLGTEAYGFVTLAKTISNYGVIITSCFNAYAARFIVVAYHEGNHKKANTYYSTVLSINVLLLIVVSFLSVIAINQIDVFFVVPDSIRLDVQVLFFLDIVNCMMLAIANVYTVGAYISNHLEYISYVKIIVYIIEAVALVVFFSCFKAHIYYVGIALLISTIIMVWLNGLVNKRLIVDIRYVTKDFSVQAVKDLVARGIWSSINQIGNLLNTGLDLWVTNLLLSAKAMGELSIVKTVYTIFAALPALITQPFQPVLLKAYANRDIPKIISTLKNELKIMGLISGLALGGFVALGESYYRLWTPGQNIDLLYKISLVTLVGFVFESIAFPLFYTYALSLKNTIACIVTIISGILNVAGMYVLLHTSKLGLYAVVGTTTVLGFFTFIIFTPIYSSWCLKIKRTTFYPTIIRIFVACAVNVCLSKFLFDFSIKSWGGLCLYGVLLMIIFVSIYCVICFSINDIKNIVHRIVQKIKG